MMPSWDDAGPTASLETVGVGSLAGSQARGLGWLVFRAGLVGWFFFGEFCRYIYMYIYIYTHCIYNMLWMIFLYTQLYCYTI